MVTREGSLTSRAAPIGDFQHGVTFPAPASSSGWFPEIQDKVVLRVRTHATHSAPFYGLEATGRRVTFTGIVIYRIVDGRIAESSGELDFLGLFRQLRSN